MYCRYCVCVVIFCTCKFRELASIRCNLTASCKRSFDSFSVFSCRLTGVASDRPRWRNLVARCSVKNCRTYVK